MDMTPCIPSRVSHSQGMTGADALNRDDSDSHCDSHSLPAIVGNSAGIAARIVRRRVTVTRLMP